MTTTCTWPCRKRDASHMAVRSRFVTSTLADWRKLCKRSTHRDVHRQKKRRRRNGGREKHHAVRSIITSREKTNATLTRCDSTVGGTDADSFRRLGANVAAFSRLRKCRTQRGA